jgi:hypothetical protein
MQSIYTYTSETNHVPKEYNVTTVLSLLFMVPISLAPALALMYFYISTFWSMCRVPNMAVFCSSLTSSFPGMVPRFSEWFWNGSSRPNYYWYHPSFYIILLLWLLLLQTEIIKDSKSSQSLNLIQFTQNVSQDRSCIPSCCITYERTLQKGIWPVVRHNRRIKKMNVQKE